jgi:tryptophan-rich sensory protein
VTGISALTLGLVGNLLTIAFAALVSWRAGLVLPLAGWLVVPVAIWTGFATAIVVGLMRIDR